MKEGHCYGNAYTNLYYRGLDYVEGVMTVRANGFKVSHAWNIDEDDRHVDFTLRAKPREYIYVGVIVPQELIEKVGERTGKQYCTLPYLRVVDLNSPFEFHYR
jgi:hypothetical protein